jgi:hypothetical protein
MSSHTLRKDNYFRVGGVHQDLPPKLIDDIWNFCDPRGMGGDILAMNNGSEFGREVLPGVVPALTVSNHEIPEASSRRFAVGHYLESAKLAEVRCFLRLSTSQIFNASFGHGLILARSLVLHLTTSANRSSRG